MNIQSLAEFIRTRKHLMVITGAGVSTGSGIPDYRDRNGEWKRKQPMFYQEFVGDVAARRRYWARSMLGWPMFAAARPNPSHLVLARLQQRGLLACLLTQNVDGLHQAAGSSAVIDLHGRLDQVVCLACRRSVSRQEMQHALLAANPQWHGTQAEMAPDGDADIVNSDLSTFAVPDCSCCGGMLKPDVVFFGENVPRDRVAAAQQALQRSDGLLVAGSSLMVWSGFRFARAAAERGVPVIAINQGKTRADGLLQAKLTAPCEEVLQALDDALLAYA